MIDGRRLMMRAAQSGINPVYSFTLSEAVSKTADAKTKISDQYQSYVPDNVYIWIVKGNSDTSQYKGKCIFINCSSNGTLYPIYARVQSSTATTSTGYDFTVTVGSTVELYEFTTS